VMASVKTLAVMTVLLAIAVHTTDAMREEEQVQMLDEESIPTMDHEAVHDHKPEEKKIHFNREAFFRGQLDTDEASLDNGDDTNLLELWNAKQPEVEKGDLGEAADTTAVQDPADSDATTADPQSDDNTEVTDTAGAADGAAGNNTMIPQIPEISPTDEKYLPAIMSKLMTMRDQMLAMKGANWEDILEHHRDGVVQIMVVKKKFMWKAAYRSPLSEEISGSGWFINNNEFAVHTNGDLLVVTNAHVAKNAAEINILVPSLGQEPIPAEVVGLCSQRDIAILKVTDKPKLLELYKAKTGKVDIVRMSLGDSDEMKRGARVMAVGYPLGLKSVKASMGIVSGYQQFKSALYLQITAPINPGNSGGPLFNEYGQVVGINSAKIASASGMSFSIASVQLKVMLDVLYQRREFVVPFLGYGFSVGTKLIQSYLEVNGDADKSGGIYITEVHPNGLFKQAGVEAGDLLLTVDGANIDRFGQTWMPTMKDNINILGLLARKNVTSPLTLGVWRKSTKGEMTLQAKYDETPPFAIPFIYEPLLNKPKFHIFAGIVFMELVENLIETLLEDNVAELIKYMKPENRMNPAVIIAGVLPGSIADLDGSVKKGLILQKFNGQEVKKIDDICAAIATATGDWFTVSTSKTFTALKAEDVAAAEGSDPEMSGKTGDYCGKLAAQSATSNSTSATNSSYFY
jgi:S1-C subfamily serine protease